MSLRFYNSLTNQIEEFKPIKNGEVTIYVCGPTVYDDAHLGHARSSIVFDLLRRTFMALGYKVLFVKNFTDIDDKIINKCTDFILQKSDIPQNKQLIGGVNMALIKCP